MSQTESERRAAGIATPGEFIALTADGETKIYSEDEFCEQWIPADSSPSE